MLDGERAQDARYGDHVAVGVPCTGVWRGAQRHRPPGWVPGRHRGGRHRADIQRGEVEGDQGKEQFGDGARGAGGGWGEARRLLAGQGEEGLQRCCQICPTNSDLKLIKSIELELRSVNLPEGDSTCTNLYLYCTWSVAGAYLVFWVT